MKRRGRKWSKLKNHVDDKMIKTIDELLVLWRQIVVLLKMVVAMVCLPIEWCLELQHPLSRDVRSCLEIDLHDGNL